jgi:hypothetical protein
VTWFVTEDWAAVAAAAAASAAGADAAVVAKAPMAAEVVVGVLPGGQGSSKRRLRSCRAVSRDASSLGSAVEEDTAICEGKEPLEPEPLLPLRLCPCFPPPPLLLHGNEWSASLFATFVAAIDALLLLLRAS